jgi:hypothetical protein
MSKILATGWESYTPENGVPGAAYYRDSLGRDWYELRHQFGEGTMKYLFDEDNYLLGFNVNAERLFPDATMTECPLSEFPELVELNGMWWADENGVRCRFEDVPKRAMAMFDVFAKLAETSDMVKKELTRWRLEPCCPYIPFPRFAPHIVKRAIRLGLDENDYLELTLSR